MPYSNTQEIVGGKIEVDKTPLIEKMKGNHWETSVIDWLWRNFFSDRGEGLYATLVYPIAGDFSRISANGKAWKYTAEALTKIKENVVENKAKLRSDGWSSGEGAQAFDDQVTLIWSPALTISAKCADYLSDGFTKLADTSVKLAEKVVKILDKVVDLAWKLFRKIVPGIGQIVGLIDWIASGLENFPYISDVQNIGRLIDEVFTLHKKISAIVSAAKGYLAGANQIVDAIKLIPDVDSSGDFGKIAGQTYKGAKEMGKQRKKMDEGKGAINEQAKKIDVILNGESPVDQSHLPH